MPRIEIYDASNTAYRIDTLDLGKVRAWLDEWAPRLAPLPSDINELPPLRMQIMPLFAWDEGRRRYDAPDWNADTRFFGWFEVPWEPAAIMDRIEQQRKAIEQAKAEGKNRL